MIQIEKTEVVGWEAAIRGLRNPMNSWELSDSELCKGAGGFEDCRVSITGKCPRHDDFQEDVFCVGQKDFDLMQRLRNAGTDHRKYMRMIVVFTDITAPLYWWKEFDTYKIGTTANSCSTMHKIHSKEFTMDDFSLEHLMLDPQKSATELVDALGDGTGIIVTPVSWLQITVGLLNNYRKMFLETKDKEWWWQMIQLLPTSYNQKRTIMLNYEVLANIYKSRKNHKLDEWRELCRWIETLPYSGLITGNN